MEVGNSWIEWNYVLNEAVNMIILGFKLSFVVIFIRSIPQKWIKKIDPIFQF